MAAPKTCFAGLQSKVIALPCTAYRTEVLKFIIYYQLFINIYNNGATPQPTRRPAATRLRLMVLSVQRRRPGRARRDDQQTDGRPQARQRDRDSKSGLAPAA